MSIFAEVLSFIREPERGRFESLALEVFRYQCANVPPYRAYVEALGLNPAAVRAVDEIPPLSTLAFKYVRTESVAGAPGPEARLFRTSGTTIGRDERGRHLVLRPEIYRASALGHLRRMFFPDNRRIAILALHPTADRMPESSLSQMISWAIEEFGAKSGAETVCTATPAGVDIASAMAFLEYCTTPNGPVAILATTAACARLFGALEEAGKPLRLPAGSRLMDTGGAKGQATPLNAAAVVALAGQWLGLAPAMVINEYGMTEMCSQLYDATAFNSARREPAATRRKLGPPWLRPFALDPATLRPVADGQPGVLAFFDLANVASVSMLLTEDLGVVEDGAVRIFGRAATAEARGCALAIAEFAAPDGDADSR
jgi:hypothetical protein